MTCVLSMSALYTRPRVLPGYRQEGVGMESSDRIPGDGREFKWGPTSAGSPTVVGLGLTESRSSTPCRVEASQAAPLFPGKLSSTASSGSIFGMRNNKSSPAPLVPGYKHGVKRKGDLAELDEIYIPPKRISPFLNTPQERKEERKRILKLSIHKLQQVENPETFLRQSVLINNTIKTLHKELMEEKLKQQPKYLSAYQDEEMNSYGVLNNSCLSNSYLFDDPFLSGVHEKITDDMTDTLVSNLQDKLVDSTTSSPETPTLNATGSLFQDKLVNSTTCVSLQSNNQSVTHDRISQNVTHAVTHDKISQHVNHAFTHDKISQHVNHAFTHDKISQHVNHAFTHDKISQNVNHAVTPDKISQHVNHAVTHDKISQPTNHLAVHDRISQSANQPVVHYNSSPTGNHSISHNTSRNSSNMTFDMTSDMTSTMTLPCPNVNVSLPVNSVADSSTCIISSHNTNLSLSSAQCTLGNNQNRATKWPPNSTGNDSCTFQNGRSRFLCQNASVCNSRCGSDVGTNTHAVDDKYRRASIELCTPTCISTLSNSSHDGVFGISGTKTLTCASANPGSVIREHERVTLTDDV